MRGRLRPAHPQPFSPLLPTAQPEWLKVISDMEADIGSNLRWGCAAAGKPRPTVRWLRNGEPLASQVGALGLPPHQPPSSVHLVPSPSRLPAPHNPAPPLAASLGQLGPFGWSAPGASFPPRFTWPQTGQPDGGLTRGSRDLDPGTTQSQNHRVVPRRSPRHSGFSGLTYRGAWQISVLGFQEALR